MLCDDFNALLIRKTDLLQLNHTAFSKIQIFKFATQNPPKATSNFFKKIIG